MLQLRGWIKKSGNWWAIGCNDIAVYTQGTTRKDAGEMLCDAICELADDPEFPVEVDIPARAEEITIGFPDAKRAIAFLLQRQRMFGKKRLADVAKIAGKSVSGIKQFESGRHDPGISKAIELFEALGYDAELVLKAKSI